MDTAKLASWLDNHGSASHYWVAYSGGLDSHVLLHLCARLGKLDGRFRFSAVHVHHGLQPLADDFAEHCARICGLVETPLRVLRVNAKAQPGQSPEEAARNARYRAFEDLLNEGEALLTAQHAEDQAETVLLQLLRGSGLAGLAAMPEAMPLGSGVLLRPLLADWNRRAFRDYAGEHRLYWMEDPSNQNTTFDRNLIRQQIMPLLVARWPGVVGTLSRTARHCAEAQEQLERLADDLLLAAREGAAGSGQANSLSVIRLRQWQAPEQRLVLRHWLKSQGFRAPSTAVLQRIIAEVLAAAGDRNPQVAWREGEVRRYRDRLYALRPMPVLDATAVYAWDGRQTLELPGNGRLDVAEGLEQGIRSECLNGTWQVRYRQGGERCRLPGRSGSHSLKKLFQEAEHVPPWLRQRMPLLYIDGQLAAVGDLWVCQPFAEGNLKLRWSGYDYDSCRVDKR